MTKIEKGIGYAKIDSLQIRIPETECIYNGSAITKTTYEIDDDSVLIQERKNKASQQFEKDGIIFTIQLQKPIKNEHDKNDYPAHFQIPMPSKILGIENYDEGWTINNFDKGIKWIEKATGIRFKNKGWAEARYSDLDNTIDQQIPAKKWAEQLNEIKQRIAPDTWKMYGRLFKDNGLTSGITLNSRNKEGNRAVTAIRPFTKAYDKAVEIMEARKAGSKWGTNYQPGERKRIEVQIRNGHWKESLKAIERPQTFEELLTVYRDKNEIMKAQIYQALECYTTLPKRAKIQRDMKTESSKDFILREMVEIMQDPNGLYQTGGKAFEIKNLIKARAITAFGNKNGRASKIAKILDDTYEMMMPDPNPKQKKLEI